MRRGLIGRVRVLVRWGKFAKFCFWWVAIPIGTAIFLCALVLFCFIHYWHFDFSEKQIDEFLSYKPPLLTEILDRNGETLIELEGVGDWSVPQKNRIPEFRRWVKYDDIPPHVRHALLAAEDQNFFEHNGLDVEGIARAIWKNAEASIAKSKRQGRVIIVLREGGSTLTQEGLEFTLLADFHKREIAGEVYGAEKWRAKIDKMRMAVWLEKALTERLGGKTKAKEKILEVVANGSYWGHGQYGILAAAHFAFGKKLAELTVPEAVMLAVPLPNPERYSPYVNPLAAIARRNEILRTMADAGFIKGDDLKAYESAPLKTKPTRGAKTEAPAAVQFVMRELWSEGTREIRWKEGVRVMSTIDFAAQRIANDALNHTLELYRKRQFLHAEEATGSEDREFFLSRARGVQGAMVVLKNGTGEILAMVGGADNNHTSFNRAAGALRQPGSSFKTFVYGAAIERGRNVWKIDCLRDGKGECKVCDSAIYVKMGYGRPRHSIDNYDGRTWGCKPLWFHFARSTNTAAMRLGRILGSDSVVDFASRLGLSRGIEAYPTTAIGAEEVTVLGIAAAYAAFANGGKYVSPRILKEVTEESGSTTFYGSEERVVLVPFLANEIAELLRHTVLYPSGTARALNEEGYPVPVAGKTGTSNDYRDAWFVGSTFGEEGITIAAWVGRDDNTPLASDKKMRVVKNEAQHCKPLHPKQKEYCEAGGKTALPMVKYFMQEYYRDKPVPQFPEGMDERIRRTHKHDTK